MKRLRIIQLSIMAAVIFAVAIFAVAGVDLFSLAMGASGGLTMAEAATGVIVDDTATTASTDAGSATLNDFDYDKLIVQELPSRTPLDTIFRTRAKKMKTSSIKVPYFTVDTKAFTDTVSALVTVADARAVNVPVDDLDMWSKHDTIIFQGIPGYDGSTDNVVTAFTNLVGRILSIDTTNDTLRVQPVNGYITGGNMVFHDNIAVATALTRSGRAEPELAMQTTPYSILPWEDYNYCQNFMAQIEESEWQKIHKQKVQWGFSDYSRLNIADMRATKEIAFLWGARGHITDLDTKEDVYTCGGVSSKITKNKTHGVTISNTDFINWRKELFEDNNGSEERYGFLGAELWAKLQAIDDVQKQMAAGETKKVFGVNFSKIEFANEVIYLHKHRLMTERGWGDYGMILDMQHITERAFQPLHETEIDLKKSGTKNATAKVIMEVSCPVVKYPATHMIISPA